MNKYELLYIISSDADEQTREAIIEKFSNMVTSSGGTIETFDKIGMKKFAYPIHGRQEGYYVLIDFKASSDFPKELDRQYRITDGILRTIIIRKEDK